MDDDAGSLSARILSRAASGQCPTGNQDATLGFLLRRARHSDTAGEVIMHPRQRATAIGLIGTAALVLGYAAPALAKTPYDGAWSVLIVTESGTCDRAYRYPVRVVDGQVRYDGEAAFTVSGRVAGNGAVNVSIRRGDQSADARGRLSAASGSGNWRSPSRQCAGTWSAERR
jgi:hypothetical protein